MEKTILNMNEASEYTGLSKGRLYRLTMDKKISFSKPGGKLIFFEKKDLDEYLLSNKTIKQN